jgi:hypothetical protein
MWFGAYTLQDYSNWTVIPGGMGMLGAFLGGIGFLGGQHVDPSVAREANSLSKGTKDRVINSKYVQALMNIIPPGTYGIIFADDPTRKAAVDSKPAAPKPTTAQMVAKEEALLSALRTDLATIPNPTKPRLTPEEFRAEVNSEAEALMGQINDRLGTTYTPTSLPTADELRQRIAYSGQSNLLDEILLTRLDILSLKRKALPPE